MPELPEVETVRRRLQPHLEGIMLTKVELRRRDLRFPFGPDFTKRLQGQKVLTLERRAKYMLAPLSSGDVLIIHLGMTGRLSIAGPHHDRQETFGAYVYGTGAHESHDHVVLNLSSGKSIVYNDPRRFGFMLVARGEELSSHRLFRHLGVEPLGPDLSAEYLARCADGRRSDTKAFLMDQSVIVGLGNIYVCEALHRAGISPFRKSGTLALRDGRPSERAKRLVPAIQSVLRAALAAGGSTLKDYRTPDGESGAFQECFAVYGQAGQACQRQGCQGIVKRSIQAGRSTFHCTACQR